MTQKGHNQPSHVWTIKPVKLPIGGILHNQISLLILILILASTAPEGVGV